MRIERRYTKEGQSPYADIDFRLTTSEIRNPDGSVVFHADNVEVPELWSQVASDVLAQKYFRKAGVPSRLKKVEEETVPSWLWRCVADEDALAELPEKERTIGEESSKQVFDRLAGTWTYWGWKGGYFSSEADAQAFFDEHRYMLAMQMVAPNSPQWFNTGLHWAYGIDGPSQGHFYVDFETGKLVQSKTAYEHPQPHACFIQSITDDLVNEGGIMDLWVREARLFKYGSGTGSNFSKLRGEGERLSGGGKSSGLMSFLKIGDRAAGAIKSGGTTRRAAKMVIVDVDHPDIEQFIDWKVIEEQKVAALVTGSKINQRHLRAVLKACVNCEGSGDDCFDPEKNPVLRREIKARGATTCRTTTSGASSSSPSRATTTSISRSTTPIGIRRPTSPSPARTPTTRCASPTSSSRRSKPTATGTCSGAPSPARSPRRSRRASCGRRSATPPGPAPIRACNSTPPSTTGTPARRRGRSTPPIRARNTCSSTTRPAISPRSICWPSTPAPFPLPQTARR